MWIAQYLRSVESEAATDRAAPGPIMWSPVGLTRSNVEFHYRDDTAGVAGFGRFSASTKDGLVRIMDGSRHLGTISQGRWNLLTVEYDPEDMCAALPGWIAQVEKEEQKQATVANSRDTERNKEEDENVEKSKEWRGKRTVHGGRKKSEETDQERKKEPREETCK